MSTVPEALAIAGYRRQMTGSTRIPPMSEVSDNPCLVLVDSSDASDPVAPARRNWAFAASTSNSPGGQRPPTVIRRPVAQFERPRLVRKIGQTRLAAFTARSLSGSSPPLRAADGSLGQRQAARRPTCGGPVRREKSHAFTRFVRARLRPPGTHESRVAQCRFGLCGLEGGVS
jgi:hypothetical protein